MKTPELLAEAVRRYREGDKESFNEIYEASYRYLYTCIANVVRDGEATMDMLQETYLEISRSIGQLRQDEDFLSWAAVIANRKCFGYLKKNREILLEQRENEGEEFFETIPDDELFIPESIFQDCEKRKLIREIIDGLSDMQRLCVICYYYNEMTQEQIAEELQIPLNTVKSHLNRAKHKIKDEIIEMDEKKGTRLYSIAPALLLFFTKEAEDCQVPPMPEDLKEAVAEESPETPDGEGKEPETGRSVVQKFLKAGIGVKVGVAVAVVVVLAGIVAAVQIFNRNSTNAVNEEEQNVQEIGGETEETVETAQETGQETEETAEEPQEESEAESADFTELAISGKYDSYGSAKDGMVVVEKDGLYGLVTFDDQIIVPIEYSDCLFRINDDGQSVFGDDGGYKVFDREGNVLFETEMWIKAVSDGVVLMVETNEEEQSYTYRYETLDGTVVNEPEYPGYIGQMGAVGFNEGYAFADDGDGDIRIQKDGSYQSMAELRAPHELSQIVHMVKDEEAQAETTGGSDAGSRFTEVNAASGLMDIMAYPLGVCHNGYYVLRGMQFEDTYGDYYIMNPEGTEQYRFRVRELYDYQGYTLFESDVDWQIDGYEVNGCSCFSYGTLMSVQLTAGEEETAYLIDLSRLEWRDYSGSEAYKDLSFDEVTLFGARRMIMPDGAVLAVGDSLNISDNKYWLVGEDGKWGYVDHAGKKQEMFDDACEFVNGKAMVIKDGRAYYIDESFQCSENGIEADSVETSGEMFIVTANGRYICLSAEE